VISFLEGEVVEKAAGRAVIAVNGTGYEVLVPTSVLASLPPVGRGARVHTRLVVREDAMVLYGFASTDEREVFDALTGVTGVGPKVALAFLSTLQTETLRRAVASGDVAALTVVPGVGKKVAQRVVIDLRDAFGGGADSDVEDVSGPIADVREALRSLGLTPQEASGAIAGLEADGRDVEDLLRDALQRVGRA
jgi:Holliday junction DNA helicase RuvA